MATRCPEPRRPLPALQAGDVLEWVDPIVRIYSSAGPYGSQWHDFRSFGPLESMRFDHQPMPRRDHPTRSVMYAATKTTGRTRSVDPLDVAILERFGSSGVVDRVSNAPRLAVWTQQRPLQLLDLTDSTWAARAGGNAALTSGARGMSRLWSRAVYRAYPAIDGLIWSLGVLPPGKSVVLFDRAHTAVSRFPSSDRPLTEKALQPALARIAATYGLHLL